MNNPDIITLKMLLSRIPMLIEALPQLLKALKYAHIKDPNIPVGMGWVLENTTAQHGNRPAILYEDVRITYNEFNAWTNRIAHYFTGRGLKKGDTVALLIENRPELLACVAGVAKTGGVNAMLNTSQAGKVLIHSFNLVKPKAAIVGEEMVDVFEQVRPQLDIDDDAVYYLADRNTLSTAGTAPGGYRNLAAEIMSQPSHNPETTQQIRIHDRCYYVYTSGTTGLPKAAVFSHGRLMKAYGGFGYGATRMRPDEVMYSTLPLYHSTAMVICWGPCLVSGAGFAIRRKFSVREFWNDTRKYNAQCFGYVGEICRYLMNQPESSSDRDNPVYKIVGTGLRPNIWKEFKARFGIEKVYEAYASSEGPTGFINMLNFDNTVGASPDSFAIVQYDKENEKPIRDAKGFMCKVKTGEAGLLITEISDKVHFDGYTQKDKTDTVVMRDAFKKGDAWYNTGDYMRSLGFRHAQFMDRLGDTYRWKGENVSTTEVENILSEFENIAESVSYGVEIPGTNGRAGMAALTLDDYDAGLDYKKLHGFLSKSLPHYAVPLFLRIRITMATTGTFKYKKTDLKKEGFDIRQFQEAVYALLPGAKEYVLLTPEIYEGIMGGKYRY